MLTGRLDASRLAAYIPRFNIALMGAASTDTLCLTCSRIPRRRPGTPVVCILAHRVLSDCSTAAIGVLSQDMKRVGTVTRFTPGTSVSLGESSTEHK